MYNTYAAVLRGRTLEWRNEGPPHTSENRELKVQMTVLEEEMEEKVTGTRGQQMAAALEKIARLSASTLPADPQTWERDLRENRTRPGRE